MRSLPILPSTGFPLRRCGKCGNDLPITSFNRHPEVGRQHWCRDCFRLYFRERGQLHRDQARAATLRRREFVRSHVLDYLQANPCVDCGERDPVVLEFDHIGEKSAGIANLVNEGTSLRRIRAEIARCEVVCANCHRLRTAARQGSWRAGLSVSDSVYLSASRWRRRRNVLFVRDVLERNSCVDCREDDICVLEFDHVGAKTKAISVLVSGEYSLSRIAAEIAHCEVRCANCHRRRTAASLEVPRHCT
jgi:hypothetical protein